MREKTSKLDGENNNNKTSRKEYEYLAITIAEEVVSEITVITVSTLSFYRHTHTRSKDVRKLKVYVQLTNYLFSFLMVNVVAMLHVYKQHIQLLYMNVSDELATKHSMVTGRAPGCGAAIFFSVFSLLGHI